MDEEPQVKTVACLLHWCQSVRDFGPDQDDAATSWRNEQLMNHSIGQVADELWWLELEASESTVLPDKPTRDHPLTREQARERIALIREIVQLP